TVERTFAWLGKCRRLSKDQKRAKNLGQEKSGKDEEAATLAPGRWNCRQRRHKSAAASAHVGNRNSNPDAGSLPGTTLRLFRSNSVSVRITKAPTSSTHRAAGSPKPIPQASRSVRMNSALGSGCGEARFTGPARSWSISQ